VRTCRDLSYELLYVVSEYTGEDAGDLRKIIESRVRRMWGAGELPYPSSAKRWIAGYRVDGSFFHASCAPVLVGPARPRYFRPRYAQATYDRRGWKR